MKSLDIPTTSPHYFYKKCMMTRKENLYFDIGDSWRIMLEKPGSAPPAVEFAAFNTATGKNGFTAFISTDGHTQGFHSVTENCHYKNVPKSSFILYVLCNLAVFN